jgi:ribonuclease T
MTETTLLSQRFRGFLPVVVDVETGGFNESTDALLQIAAVIIDIDQQGQLYCSETVSCHVTPFEGANLDPKSMEVNGIDIDHPFRLAVEEKQALPNQTSQLQESHIGRT